MLRRSVKWMLVFFVSLVFFSFPSRVSAQSINWLHQFGTTGQDFAKRVVVDQQGNRYVSSDVAGPAHQEILLSKYDSHGNHVWDRQLTGLADLFGYMSIDQQGGVLIAGTGALERDVQGNTYGGFVRKYNPSGDIAWTRLIGPQGSWFFNVDGIGNDFFGNIYIGGMTNWNFPGFTYLGGYADLFLLKLDSNGDDVWVRQFGTTSDDWMRDLTVDQEGAILITGGTSGSYPGFTNSNLGIADGVVLKFDASGNILWVRQFGASESEDSFFIATGGVENNIYISGSGFFQGGFIRKYTSNGQEVWTESVPSFGPVAVGTLGQLYLAGDINYALPGQRLLGAYDGFVQEYNPAGNLVWSYQFGTSVNDGLFDAVLDRSNGLMLTGYTRDSLPGYVNLGGADAFVARLVLPNQPPVASAGPDLTGNEGENLTFDGSASTDPDGLNDIVDYNWDFGDGGMASGVVVNHTYTTPGVYTASLTVVDGAGLTNSDTALITVNSVRRITSLSPANVWIGLRTSDDIGIKFDLMAEAYKDSTLLTSGELSSVTGGSSGFNNAHLQTIAFNSFSPVDFPDGSALSIKLYVRNACNGSGHNSGTARLWYNDGAANSGFGATIAVNSYNYYLTSNSVLSTVVGIGPKQTTDVVAGSKCSAFKLFGTWSTTP